MLNERNLPAISEALAARGFQMDNMPPGAVVGAADIVDCLPAEELTEISDRERLTPHNINKKTALSGVNTGRGGSDAACKSVCDDYGGAVRDGEVYKSAAVN